MKEIDSPEATLEQSQESKQVPTQLSRTDLESVHHTANQLIQQLEVVPDGDLVGEIVANALKLLRDQTNRGDIKLINVSLKELRYALKIFAPYRDVLKVSIFGSARTPEDPCGLRLGRSVWKNDGGGRLDGHHRRGRWHHGGRARWGGR